MLRTSDIGQQRSLFSSISSERNTRTPRRKMKKCCRSDSRKQKRQNMKIARFMYGGGICRSEKLGDGPRTSYCKKRPKRQCHPKNHLAISRKRQQNTSIYEKEHGWSEKCRSFGTRNTHSVLAEKERHSVNTSALELKIAAVCRRNTLQQS